MSAEVHLYYMPMTLSAAFHYVTDPGADLNRAGYFQADTAPASFRLFDSSGTVEEYGFVKTCIENMIDAGFPNVVVVRDQPACGHRTPKNMGGFIEAVRGLYDDACGPWTSFETNLHVYFGFANETDAVHFKLVSEDIVG